MKVLVLEPQANGHHGPYLEWMVNGMVERGFEVSVITLPEAANHPSLRALVQVAQCTENSLRMIVSSAIASSFGKAGINSLAARELAYWRLFRAWYKAQAESVNPDIVFLPYADYCLNMIGLLGSPFGTCPWAGLSMRPSFHYQRMGLDAPMPKLAGIKKALFTRVLRNRYLTRLLTNDEPLVHYFEDNHKASGKLYYFPEPTDLSPLPEMAEAKKNLGLDPARKVILLYGGLTRRKGIEELLLALASPKFPSAVDVLLAGKVSESAVEKLLASTWVLTQRAAGRLTMIDRFIESEEEPALFAAADMVWLGYRSHYGASGQLAQAVYADRPVLACKDGVLGWLTRRHGLGLVVDPTNLSEVVIAVRALLEPSPETLNRNRCKNSWRPPTIAQAQEALAHMLKSE